MKMKRKDKQAEKCIEEILLENYDRYYHLAYSYTHNEADAQDIVQKGVYKAILYSDKPANKKQVLFSKTFLLKKSITNKPAFFIRF